MSGNVEGAIDFSAGEAQREKHEAQALYLWKKLENNGDK